MGDDPFMSDEADLEGRGHFSRGERVTQTIDCHAKVMNTSSIYVCLPLVRQLMKFIVQVLYS